MTIWPRGLLALHAKRTSAHAAVELVVQLADLPHEFPVRFPVLAEEAGHVGALSLPTQPDAAQREILDLEDPGSTCVQEAEEPRSVGRVQLLRSEESPCPLVLQVVPELLPSDLVYPVVVDLLEDLPQIGEEGLLRGQLGLRHYFAVVLAQLPRPLHEDARENVEHSDQDDEDVESKE